MEETSENETVFDPIMDGVDYDSKYDSDDYKARDFVANFDDSFGDRLEDIRHRVGRDQEEAVNALAAELFAEYVTPFASPDELADFVWSRL